jgi:hypothetical protein
MYNNLQKQVRWYEWGDKSIAQAVTVPGHMGADESPLLKVLEGDSHRGSVTLSDDERAEALRVVVGNAASSAPTVRQNNPPSATAKRFPPHPCAVAAAWKIPARAAPRHPKRECVILDIQRRIGYSQNSISWYNR